MSTIAIIYVNQCDGCRTVAVSEAGEDRDPFPANWFGGLNFDFCPECRNKVEHAAAIEADIAASIRLVAQGTEGGFGDSETSQFRQLEGGFQCLVIA